MSQLLLVMERLQAVFEQAAKDRDKRPDFVTKDGRTEPAWVAYEREMMHEAVTKERAKLGKGPIALKKIERVERMALGHVDYSAKFSLYCAELVLNQA
jgi:uncharacterized protein YkuJ